MPPVVSFAEHEAKRLVQINNDRWEECPQLGVDGT